MTWLLSLLEKFGMWLLGKVLGGPSSDEKLGQAETDSAGNKKELDDAQKAVNASRTAGDADDAGGVRDAKPGDKPWNPNGVG